jgi:hypothetical protein
MPAAILEAPPEGWEQVRTVEVGDLAVHIDRCRETGRCASRCPQVPGLFAGGDSPEEVEDLLPDAMALLMRATLAEARRRPGSATAPVAPVRAARHPPARHSPEILRWPTRRAT